MWITIRLIVICKNGELIIQCKLNNIRKPDHNIKLSRKIINSLLILILGIALGIFSKCLDNIAINNEIWWQNILEILNLGNVFSELGVWVFLALTISVLSKTPVRSAINVLLFFIGMTLSYHLYTIIFSGFNPKSYMLIWYGLTLFSPILAYISWYAKGNNKVSIVLSGGIIAIMMLLSFSIGIWYFDFKSLIDTFLFTGVVTVLYTNAKNIGYSLFIGTILTFIFSVFRIIF